MARTIAALLALICVLQESCAIYEELTQEYWVGVGQNELKHQLKVFAKKKLPGDGRSVVFMVGSGMSVTTIRAAGLLKAQRGGENNSLHFEQFPTVGMIKTYCEDYQVGDAACVATAYSGGRLSKFGQVGLMPDDNTTCGAAGMESIVKWALDAGKDVGIVTNGRVTHPLISPLYGYSTNGSWEADSDVTVPGCRDIADHLINGEVGSRIKVIMGGGRSNFLPRISGRRNDGRNLVEDWKAAKDRLGVDYVYAESVEEMKKIRKSPHVLGLFKQNHFEYKLKQKKDEQPSLEDMVQTAIKILNRNRNGYLLFVVDDLIRRAHELNMAKHALEETLDFAAAVKKADEMTDRRRTLLLVTSDHGSTMTVSGYSNRWNDINGLKTQHKELNYTYSTLFYATGPGYIKDFRVERAQQQFEHIADMDFAYPSAVYEDRGKEGGEDVGLFARGPHDDIFTGTYEMHLLPHLMGYATCIGPGRHSCGDANSSASTKASVILVIVALVKLFV